VRCRLRGGARGRGSSNQGCPPTCGCAANALQPHAQSPPPFPRSADCANPCQRMQVGATEGHQWIIIGCRHRNGTYQRFRHVVRGGCAWMICAGDLHVLRGTAHPPLPPPCCNFHPGRLRPPLHYCTGATACATPHQPCASACVQWRLPLQERQPRPGVRLAIAARALLKTCFDAACLSPCVFSPMTSGSSTPSSGLTATNCGRCLAGGCAWWRSSCLPRQPCSSTKAEGSSSSSSS